MIRAAKKNYFRKLNPRRPKEFWKAIKYANKNKPSRPTLENDSRVAHSDTEKANLLNSYFVHILIHLVHHSLLTGWCISASLSAKTSHVVSRRYTSSSPSWIRRKQMVKMASLLQCSRTQQQALSSTDCQVVQYVTYNRSGSIPMEEISNCSHSKGLQYF